MYVGTISMQEKTISNGGSWSQTLQTGGLGQQFSINVTAKAMLGGVIPLVEGAAKFLPVWGKRIPKGMTCGDNKLASQRFNTVNHALNSLSIIPERNHTSTYSHTLHE